MRRFSLLACTLFAVLALPAAAKAAWGTQSVSAPGGSLSEALNGVHCTATNACTSVGRYNDSGSVQQALAQRWNGASWSAQTPAAPGGAQAVELFGVNCYSSTACKAVGTYRDSSAVNRTVAYNYSGGSWSRETTIDPTGFQAASLIGVDCTASNQCTGVGSFINSSGVQVPLAERWTTAWAQQTVTPPGSSTQTALSGVDCTGSSACIAVGFQVVSRVRLTYAVTWNGATWSAMTTPNPAVHNGTVLAGISCTSGSACTAVGSTLDSRSETQPIAMRWDGANWTLDTVPIPGGATGGSFSSVSCTSASHCNASGYTYSGANPLSLTEGWASGTWTVQTAANPGGAASARLNGTACTSSTYCVASGAWINGSAQERQFVERGP
jgi:hypothetical protein